MPIDFAATRSLLKSLDLKRLFIEQLNWDNPSRQGGIAVTASDDVRVLLTPLAEKGGMVVFRAENRSAEGIPDRAVRLRVHSELLAQAHEHIIVFVNKPGTATLWMWVEREGGRRRAVYEHRYHTDQPGDSLLQKLEGLAFDWDDLDEFGRASIIAVTARVQAALATDRVTKRFYDEFKSRHGHFLEFIEGIEALRDREWYASIMLNRLMFIYFIQKKRFLSGDADYLRNRLEHCKRSGIPYYRGFLTTLFFDGFACRPEERTERQRSLLGEVPYLNGGLFLKHQIEHAHHDIDIPDEAFRQLFDFFDSYQWHLDDRPLREDNEINPDVLGYIFEKYINQKQMGAYYTREDITEYISKNTILPFLFDRLESFHPEAVVSLPISAGSGIEPYIHDAVRHGVEVELPSQIAVGLDDVSGRGEWNRSADERYALPTETWREHIARRQRYQQILDDYAAGKIAGINDFITYNLDIIKYTEDFLTDTDDPMVIRAFYFDCLSTVRVLDPTCGSGAFLFAALNLLQPLYALCLQRMEELLARRERNPQWAQRFEQELEKLAEHPSRDYFIYKSIIINNLFGVDIMEEAVEICKLRLFLKLVAQVEQVSEIEPLPDIDFNILAGNTLVGYATREEIDQAKAAGETGTGVLDFGDVQDRIKAVDRSLSHFRDLQMQHGFSAQHFREAKENLKAQLAPLEEELNRDLAFAYGADSPENKFARFVESHRPFHWYVQFYDIMLHGGFDVIIGNPPYVSKNKVAKEYSVEGYATSDASDIYAWVLERTVRLSSPYSRVSMIVPLSLTFSRFFGSLRKLLIEEYDTNWFSSYDNIPAPLFSGVSQRCTIWIGQRQADLRRLWVAPMVRWRAQYRPHLLHTVAYTNWPRLDAITSEIPKLASTALQSYYQLLSECKSVEPTRFNSALDKSDYHLSYSLAARNFISIFVSEPPCFDANSLLVAEQTKIAFIPVISQEMAYSALAAVSAEAYLGYWLIRGDGFDVTKWIVADYLTVLNCIPTEHYTLLSELGHLLDQRRHEALVFKKNAGKYVGNYNYWLLPEIGRRADLVLLAGLRLSRTHADEVREYVQRVLAINKHAGEKGIPDEVRERVPSIPVNTELQAQVFAQADRIIKNHFGYTDNDLEAILSHDIRSRDNG